MKKNGFTLVEVLAIIALIAIVVLTTTYSITTVMEDSKKGTYRNNILSLIQAANTMIIQGTYTTPITFTFSESGPDQEIKTGGGKMPISGSLTFLNSGVAVINQLSDGTYCISGVDSDNLIVQKNGECKDLSYLY